MTSDLFREYLHILACPACKAELHIQNDVLTCKQCCQLFAIDNGISLLFHPHDPGDKRDVTEIVKAFYEETPFPNYDDLDSREMLAMKARQGVFAAALDEQLPPGALVLEAGCGTGQLTNFLGLSWQRRVFGGDICLNSLRLANGFRRRFHIANAAF